MLYCGKCMLVTDNKKCPMCSNKKLVDVDVKDPVYLITKEMIWSDMICDVLDENNIPYLKHGNLGTALSVMFGESVEYYKFYVPYGEYEKTVEFMKELFPSDYDIDVEDIEIEVSP
jgi:hypothetical protein